LGAVYEVEVKFLNRDLMIPKFKITPMWCVLVRNALVVAAETVE
jgi:hypothetical protein